MKKLLGILILGLFLSGNAYANINSFNKWLYVNGHYEYLDKESDNVRYILDRSVCKSKALEEDYNIIKKCIGADGTIIPNSDLKFKKIYPNNLDIKTYRGWIPEEVAKPNYGTLLYEFYKYTVFPFKKANGPDKYEIDPSSNPYEFKSNLQEDKYIDKQFQKTGLISYLRFEDGQITIDKISPNDRFGKFISNKTKLRSMSAGKTMTSYVVGHAICDGYIDNINSRLNDWPLIENTLYYDQKLIDLLNMKAGDRKYVQSSNLFIKGTRFHGDSANYRYDIEDYISVFKNSKKIKNAPFNYSEFSTNLILNYVLFKTGDDFEKILEKTFKEKAKIEDSVFFYKVPNSSKEKGDANNMFFATRYDYLRIAKAMLDDWQNDTCVGKYLKTIFDNRIEKENDKRRKEGKKVQWVQARGYAGQFQTHYKGISKKRPVMGMHGRGGQHIVIDFERSRIIVTNSVYENFNYKKIVYSVINKGK